MAIPTNANKIVSSKSNTYFKANNITIGTAVPTKGTYAKGDLIINSSPNATAIGWICTAAGTPGSWKAIKSGVDVTSIAWNSVSSKPSTFTPTLGVTSSTAFRGDYGNAAYQHSQSDHAPSNAQKNSDITKAEIEAKLKGTITSHTHNYAGSSSAGGSANSAVKLATARKIGAANFDGTGNITLNSILGTVQTVGTTTTNKNKYIKFASIDISGGSYVGCYGKLIFTPAESNNGFNGTLYYFFKTGGSIEYSDGHLTWETLNSLDYKNNVYAVKTANGKFDLYLKEIKDWSTEYISIIPIAGWDNITLIKPTGFVDKITPITTSDIPNNYALLNHTHKTITIQGNGTSLGTFNGGADKTINITASNIGAAASSHTHNYAGSSSAGGAANSANKVNSTLTIQGNGKSLGTFNGSAAATINITAGNIGAATSGHTHSNYAATSHSHGLLNSNFTKELANTTTDSGWSMINATYQGFLLTALRSNASAPNWMLPNYASGIVFGGSDTKGVLSVAYSEPTIRFAGGAGKGPAWHYTIKGSNSKEYNLENFVTTSQLGDIQSILTEINGE